MLLRLGMNKNYLHILPDHIDKTTVLWQANITKTQREKLESVLQNETSLHILIMNVEGLSTDKGVNFARKFLSSHNTLMAVMSLLQ